MDPKELPPDILASQIEMLIANADQNASGGDALAKEKGAVEARAAADLAKQVDAAKRAVLKQKLELHIGLLRTAFDPDNPRA